MTIQNVKLMKKLREQMKPVSEMTDQELNEWIEDNILFSGTTPNYGQTDLPLPTKFKFLDGHNTFKFDCNNLNHAYLMEEKIWELGEKTATIYLKQLAAGCQVNAFGLSLQGEFDYIHKSARRRCEAAYLTFKNS